MWKFVNINLTFHPSPAKHEWSIQKSTDTECSVYANGWLHQSFFSLWRWLCAWSFHQLLIGCSYIIWKPVKVKRMEMSEFSLFHQFESTECSRYRQIENHKAGRFIVQWTTGKNNIHLHTYPFIGRVIRYQHWDN